MSLTKTTLANINNVSDISVSIMSRYDFSMRGGVGFGHITPVSDTGKNLRNLQCLAVECEHELLPGGRMETKSVADSQVGGGGRGSEETEGEITLP